jgi:FKBP-type peptidyl-prolyl cis-trans isomerase FkpA
MRIDLAVGLILSIPSVLLAQDRPEAPLGPNPREVEFAASLGIDLDGMIETESGLSYREDFVGTGEPAVLLDTVWLTYTGYLADGTVFYRGEVTATLGSTDLIAGFTEGLVGMRFKGMRTLVIPADLAYGGRGRRPIPPNAVLVFEIDLTGVQKART